MSEWKVTFRVLLPNGDRRGCYVLHRVISVEPIEGDDTLEVKDTSTKARISWLWCESQIQTEGT